MYTDYLLGLWDIMIETRLTMPNGASFFGKVCIVDRETLLASSLTDRICLIGDIYLCFDLFLYLCFDLCLDLCVDLCIDLCLDLCVDLCLDLCVDLCLDLCVDLCFDHLRFDLLCFDLLCFDLCFDSAEVTLLL